MTCTIYSEATDEEFRLMMGGMVAQVVVESDIIKNI